MNTEYLDPHIVSDLHKDAYGFRPVQDFWTEWYLLNDEGKRELWDSMVEALNSDLF